jgi:hypothetical protein
MADSPTPVEIESPLTVTIQDIPEDVLRLIFARGFLWVDLMEWYDAPLRNTESNSWLAFSNFFFFFYPLWSAKIVGLTNRRQCAVCV